MQGLSYITDLPLVRGVNLGTGSLYPKFPEREKQQIHKKFGIEKNIETMWENRSAGHGGGFLVIHLPMACDILTKR